MKRFMFIMKKFMFIVKRFIFIIDRYRVAKSRRMPYLYRSFSAKEPYNQWLICGK